MSDEYDEFDFIIVGSGAGGAPLAARLAERGYAVLVIEAGPRHTVPADNPAHEISEVPAFHGVSTEKPELSWAFPVEHFGKPPQPNDSKYNKNSFPSIYYPRATGIGGCTIHHAMITVLAPEADWDAIAELTSDASWRGRQMRAYFEKLECCQYRRRPSGLSPSGARSMWSQLRWVLGKDRDATGGGHGFDGWLATSQIDLTLGKRDLQLIKLLKAAAIECGASGLGSPFNLIRNLFKGKIAEHLDCNDRRTMEESPEGLALIPVAIHSRNAKDPVRRGHRSSPRERLLEVEAKSKAGQLPAGGRLEIFTDCLVTRIIVEGGKDGDEPRATAVEFIRGASLYRAVPKPEAAAPAPEPPVRAKREIILCGGAFNTPQLLMLSGIGDKEHLNAHGIPCHVNRPGVGQNLQDRYEVTVISEMQKNFSLLEGATFDVPAANGAPDPHLAQWRRDGSGIYTTNGAVLGIVKRSRPELARPDLFIFGVPLPFTGYYKDYSKVGSVHDRFTWCILKSHTENRDGTVRLRSRDPRDLPSINFCHFNETTRKGRPIPDHDPDLNALVEGVKFVRRIADRAGSKLIKREQWPGREPGDCPPGEDKALREFIVRETWGHHASCTCAIGCPDDPKAVLDSRFRVLGDSEKPDQRVRGLRVVDASVFPRIPGWFIVSCIYAVSEKAAAVIAEDHPL